MSVNSAAYRQALKPKNKTYPTCPIANAVRLSKICVNMDSALFFGNRDGVGDLESVLNGKNEFVFP